MLKRPLLWVLASAGVLVVVLVGLLLLADPSPFAFLRGRTPMRQPLNGVRLRGSENYLYYSFKGDFAQVRRRARIELQEAGYAEVTEDANHNPERVAVFARRLASGAAIESPQSGYVSIYRDSQFVLQPVLGGTSLWPESAPGYVSVVVARPPSAGILVRLRKWLGLQ